MKRIFAFRQFATDVSCGCPATEGRQGRLLLEGERALVPPLSAGSLHLLCCALWWHGVPCYAGMRIRRMPAVMEGGAGCGLVMPGWAAHCPQHGKHRGMRQEGKPEGRGGRGESQGVETTRQRETRAAQRVESSRREVAQLQVRMGSLLKHRGASTARSVGKAGGYAAQVQARRPLQAAGASSRRALLDAAHAARGLASPIVIAAC